MYAKLRLDVYIHVINPCLLRIGVDYRVHVIWNEMQEAEYCTGDLREEEYEESLWQGRDLSP